MSSALNQTDGPTRRQPQRPFRRAVLRGLGVVLPPLLTIVILVWVGNTVQEYVLVPVETVARHSLVWSLADIHEKAPDGITETTVKPDGTMEMTVKFEDQQFIRLEHGQYIPVHVYEMVRTNLGTDPMPETGDAVYHRYVQLQYLKRQYVIPAFLCVFILFLYLLGKSLAARLGRMFWNLFEQLFHGLPLVRNVYASVKQVTDFVFSESEIEYTRVVAVEYPRKGIWSIGFVTGESMLDIRCAANEQVLSVLMPTSPMPVTGFTITVLKSETVDLDLTIDQALQFVISCGVVVPPQQIQDPANERFVAALQSPESTGNGQADRRADKPPTPESASSS